MRMLGRNAIVSSVIFGILFMLPGLLPGMSAATAQAQPPQQTLNQYIADLQKNPNDYALLEKIIKHVQTMSPTPAIPSVVDEHIGKAEFILKKASAPSDFIDAANAIRDALMVAPWLVDYYNDLGVLYEKANQYEEATKYFEFYLKVRPDTPDAQKIRKKIGGLKYATEKAAKESSPTAIAEKKQSEFETWLKKIDGRKYRETRGGPVVIEVRDKSIVLIGPGVAGGPWEIKGRSASTPRVMQQLPFPVQTTFIISEDGERMIEHRDFIDGTALEFVWLIQR